MTPEELREWRIQNGYSQNDLAEALQVTKLTITRWENKKREIPSFLHLALKSLKRKGGEIKKGRPKGSTTGKKTKKKGR